jgi:hypothetical protein
MVFDGTTATNATSTASQNTTDIISFTIANKSGGAITASVGIFYGSAITYVLYNEPLGGSDPNNYVYLGNRIRVLPDYQIFVSVSGTADYYFTIE